MGLKLKTDGEPKVHEKPKTVEELRQSPRLECTGLAGIQTLPVSEMPCPARIVNLSVGGCLMELKSPLTLAVDEVVELIFNVNQMPFRVRGIVRVIRSEKMVGFQFPPMSKRSRGQLEELISELVMRLVRLHRDSLAKQPLVPEEPAAKAKVTSHPIKPAGGRHGDAVNRLPEELKWF